MIGNNKICDKCNSKISLSNFNKHYLSCNGTIKNKIKIQTSWLQSDGKYKCPYCNKCYTKNGISTHIWKSHGDGKQHKPNLGKTGWLNGKTLDVNYKEKISNSLKGKSHKHSQETKRKLSIAAKKNSFGGNTSKYAIYYKQKNGNIVYLQSNYEVIVAKDLDNNDINWERPKPLMWIDENNVKHRYYPDFYLIDYNIYLDPKNDFLIEKDKLKIESVCKQRKSILG